MIVNLQEDDEGNLVLPLTTEFCESLGWKVGDVVVWKDNLDGTFTLTKKEKQ